jgi:hypothetical protein
MGNGALTTLAKDQHVEVSLAMREEYEKLVLLNLPEDELQRILMEKFNLAFKENMEKTKTESIAVEEVVTTKPEPSSRRGSKENNVAHITPSLSKKGGIKAVPSKRKPGDANRRRSFGPEAKGNLAAVASISTIIKPVTDATVNDTPLTIENTLIKSASVPVLPVTEPPVIADSWDSVTQQPFCNLCQMAFKSNSFLDRHIKFSDMHAKAVKKAADIEAGKVESIKEKVQVLQEEGKHFKLLYSGSKLFWRTKDSCEVFLYHHLLPNCIEAIIYDGDTGKELPRLYFDYELTLSIIKDEVDAQKEIKVLENKDNTQKGLEKIIPESEIRDTVQRTILTTNIISKFQQTDVLNTESTVRTVSFVLSDNLAVNPSLVKPPIMLVPVVIARRRRSSSEEINNTLKGLESDRAALVAATGNAERITASILNSIASMAVRANIYKGVSLPRRRWIKSIRQVIAQAHVKKITERLEEIAARDATKSKSQNRAIRSSTLVKEL